MCFAACGVARGVLHEIARRPVELPSGAMRREEIGDLSTPIQSSAYVIHYEHWVDSFISLANWVDSFNLLSSFNVLPAGFACACARERVHSEASARPLGGKCWTKTNQSRQQGRQGSHVVSSDVPMTSSMVNRGVACNSTQLTTELTG